MPTPVTMPKLGESVVEGTVARWLKSPGDPVIKLEPLLEINTDKIDTEIPAPAAGTLLNIVVPEGETVEAGTVLAYIGEADEAPNGIDRPFHESAPATPAETTENATLEPSSADTAPEETIATPAQAGTTRNVVGRIFLSPVVRQLADKHDVPLEEVEGTGTRGRITKHDVLAYIEQQKAQESVHETAQEPDDAEGPVAPAVAPQAPLVEKEAIAATEYDGVVIEPLSLMRRAIAQHMVASKRASPHVTTIFEVDMTAVVRHRESLKDARASKRVHVTFTAYFVAAVAQALAAAPAVNPRFVDNDGSPGIVHSKQVHIGLAVSLEDGLIVPVIRDADTQSLVDLARMIDELATKARAGKLAPDATQGGTFTITNHGVSGSLIGTPIINQPQAGILGIGAIVKRPMVRSAVASLLPSADDAIVIRPMCYLNFSFDHRVLDGAQADHFVAMVKDTLENWSTSS